MSTPYHDILSDIALRVNAFTATTPEDLQTAYETRPLTSALFDSTIAPFDAMISALLLAEEKLVLTMATSNNPTLRAPLAGQTEPLANGALVPSEDVTGEPIVGVFGAVLDVDDLTVCREKTLEEIERRNRNAGSAYKIATYAYRFDGGRIFHTRTNVVIDCCIYNRATQKGDVEANNNMLLPDDLGEAIICGAVASLIRDDEYTEQASIYARYFEDTLQRLSAGLQATSSKVTAQQ